MHKSAPDPNIGPLLWKQMNGSYSIAGGQNIHGLAIFSQFVVYIFVVAACTAGKGR